MEEPDLRQCILASHQGQLSSPNYGIEVKVGQVELLLKLLFQLIFIHLYLIGRRHFGGENRAGLGTKLSSLTHDPASVELTVAQNRTMSECQKAGLASGGKRTADLNEVVQGVQCLKLQSKS